MLREVLPSPDLRDWVDRFWIRSTALSRDSVAILPDGSADIVFDLGGGPGPLSEAFVVGAMTRPLVVAGPAPEMLGIRFRPGRGG
ncbi:MAG TPA: DUF6597 domain-containing transcriptional factor, partial [Thermoanaerobaculia bacterium]|nr:DUF6597 domain-containing transcriptional factor [Thermoanaerobaculia bacterium]